jgi:type I restriction enzyme, S subunit
MFKNSNHDFIRAAVDNQSEGGSNHDIIRRHVERSQNRESRSFSVVCDYETSARAGAAGTFQVIELMEAGRDVTHLVDQGFHFVNLERLRLTLAKKLQLPPEDIEIEELAQE